MDNLLAKTKENGIITLIEHTDAVVNNVINILKEHNEENTVIVKSAKLHDIGKICNKYQDFFGGKNVEISNNERHNIVGWAFIVKYLDDVDYNKIALNVLWHHGNYNNCAKVTPTEILKKVSEDEINKMAEFAKSQGFKIHAFNGRKFNTNFSDIELFDRAVLIASDAIASSKNKTDITINRKNEISVSNAEFLQSERTKAQLGIADSIKEGVNLIKAPAGFGKTMVGLLWTIKRNNKLVWVCPTNVIAESVYESIKKECSMLGADMSLELFLSGERKNLYRDGNEIDLSGSSDGIIDKNTEVFNSDITVTNIDNFAKTTCDNSDAKRALSIYDCDVIFDESHYYDEMECALHSIYTKVYEKRMNLNRTTILLTATPSITPSSDHSDAVNIIPNKDEHFKAIHSCSYEIKFIKPSEIKKTVKDMSNYIFYSNTVQKTQVYYKGSKSKNKVISHAQFLIETKEKNKNKVINNFTKSGKIEDFDVFSSPYLTTGCDFSIENMIIDSPSYKTLFQAIGRINRYGDYQKSVIVIVDDLKKDKTVFCGESVNRKLYDMLKVKSEYTLDELYVIYNTFINNNKFAISEHICVNLERSEIFRSMIFPFRHIKNNNLNTNLKAGSNKLRKTDSSELFILIQVSGSDEWVIVQDSASYGTKNKYDTTKSPYNIKLARQVIKQNGISENYPDINEQNLVSLSLIAYDSLTPLPVFNYVYNKEIGICKSDVNDID